MGCYPGCKCKACAIRVTRAKTGTRTCATARDLPLICCDEFWAAHQIQKMELGSNIVVMFKQSNKIIKGVLTGVDCSTGNTFVSVNKSPCESPRIIMFNLANVCALGSFSSFGLGDCC